MTKTLQEDISQSRYQKKKILRHEGVEHICEENKCREVRRKKTSLEEEEELEKK